MTLKQEIRDLLEEVAKTQEILAKILAFRSDFQEDTLLELGRTRVSAITFAEIFDRYYTALETMFLRISQYYGNGLDSGRWHSDLLHKMTLTLPDVRQAMLQDETAALLQELLRFRHFRRYYFELEYDWDKIDFLNKKLDEAVPLVTRDLTHFAGFLNALLANNGL